jgi:hypothetical protein
MNKKQGLWWFYGGYHTLNVKIKDKFLILIVEELLDKLQGVVFTKLDLCSG